MANNPPTFCRYFGSAMGCKNEDQCRHSHANPNSVPVCRNITNFANPQGCYYGNNCRFRHAMFPAPKENPYKRDNVTQQIFTQSPAKTPSKVDIMRKQLMNTMDFESLPFETRTFYRLECMEFKEKLLTIGYLRENAKEAHDIDIPDDIMQYVVVYNYDEAEHLWLGNFSWFDTKDRKHKWKLFISCSKYRLMRPMTIEQVWWSVPYIWTRYTQQRGTVEKKSPFYLEHHGFNNRSVTAEIKFKKGYEKKDMKVNHEVCFGNYASITKVADKKSQDDIKYFDSPKDYPIYV